MCLGVCLLFLLLSNEVSGYGYKCCIDGSDVHRHRERRHSVCGGQNKTRTNIIKRRAVGFFLRVGYIRKRGEGKREMMMKPKMEGLLMLVGLVEKLSSLPSFFFFFSFDLTLLALSFFLYVYNTTVSLLGNSTSFQNISMVLCVYL